jgi:hypothetical protein
MGNDQQVGSRDHILMNPSNDENKQPERQSPPGPKSSWQVARDLSMDLLSRKTTKLSLKPGVYRFLFFNH